MGRVSTDQINLFEAEVCWWRNFESLMTGLFQGLQVEGKLTERRLSFKVQ